MRLLFHLIIISIFILNSGCSLSKPIRKKQALAYGSLWEGEPEKAREYLNSARDNHITKFLLISIELSEENLEKAEYYTEQFIADHKDIPDGKVLLNLVQRRKSFPDERWVHSYAIAWREAGSPKLKVFEEFHKDYWWNIENQDYEDNRKEIPVCTLDYLLASHGIITDCDNKKDFEAFLGQITSDLPLEIKLLVLNYFASDVFLPDSFIISDELKQEIKRKRSDIIHQLSFELPSDMKFAIMDILEQTPREEPLSLNQIELLEKAVARQRLAPSKYELYSLYLARYRSLGSKNPQWDAYQVAGMSNIIFIPSNLTRRIDASVINANPQMKKRFANILEKVGKAYLKRKVFIDFLLGIGLLPSAYRIRGDKEAEERLKEAYNTIRNTFHIVSSSYASSVAIWPIAPLMIDAIEFELKDEIGFYLLLTGKEMPDVISGIINEPLIN